jgi:hypothetical protein
LGAPTVLKSIERRPVSRAVAGRLLHGTSNSVLGVEHERRHGGNSGRSFRGPVSCACRRRPRMRRTASPHCEAGVEGGMRRVSANFGGYSAPGSSGSVGKSCQRISYTAREPLRPSRFTSSRIGSMSLRQ